MPFNGRVVAFGAMVEHHPISVKDLSRLYQFGPKVLSGLFLVYALHPGGIWEGGILVADIEELEVLAPMSGGKFIFPVAGGTVKLSGRDQVLRM